MKTEICPLCYGAAIVESSHTFRDEPNSHESYCMDCGMDVIPIITPKEES